MISLLTLLLSSLTSGLIFDDDSVYMTIDDIKNMKSTVRISSPQYINPPVLIYHNVCLTPLTAEEHKARVAFNSQANHQPYEFLCFGDGIVGGGGVVNLRRHHNKTHSLPTGTPFEKCGAIINQEKQYAALFAYLDKEAKELKLSPPDDLPVLYLKGKSMAVWPDTMRWINPGHEFWRYLYPHHILLLSVAGKLGIFDDGIPMRHLLLADAIHAFGYIYNYGLGMAEIMRIMATELGVSGDNGTMHIHTTRFPMESRDGKYPRLLCLEQFIAPATRKQASWSAIPFNGAAYVNTKTTREADVMHVNGDTVGYHGPPKNIQNHVEMIDWQNSSRYDEYGGNDAHRALLYMQQAGDMLVSRQNQGLPYLTPINRSTPISCIRNVLIYTKGDASHRRLLNWRELSTLMKTSFGLETTVWHSVELRSLADQISGVSMHDIVIFPHSAFTTVAVFMRTNSVMIELDIDGKSWIRFLGGASISDINYIGVSAPILKKPTAADYRTYARDMAKIGASTLSVDSRETAIDMVIDIDAFKDLANKLIFSRIHKC